MGLLSACSDEPEVVVVEPIEEDQVDYAQTETASWDADGDGLLNQEEFSTLRNTSWDAWDTNRDESLSREEFATGWTEAGFTDAASAFDALDRDGDGSVVQADFLSTALWERWDVDNSGVLEAGEFPHY